MIKVNYIPSTVMFEAQPMFRGDRLVGHKVVTESEDVPMKQKPSGVFWRRVAVVFMLSAIFLAFVAFRGSQPMNCDEVLYLNDGRSTCTVYLGSYSK